MIQIEHTDIQGWEPAIRGMRNPMNSWDKSDSKFFDEEDHEWLYVEYHDINNKCDYVSTCKWPANEKVVIGPNDLDLMKRLVAGGSVHAKFRRMIAVWCDITAPLYWWKQFKTYRFGRKFADSDEDGFGFIFDPEYAEYDIEMNSCSTMHKIHAKEFELDDFGCEHLLGLDDLGGTTENIKVYDPDTNSFENDKIDYGFNILKAGGFMPWAIMGDGSYALSPKGVLTEAIIPALNKCRELYLETKDKKYWWQMIQLLPSSYNQKRTVMLNYEVLSNMYHQRKNHKLDEWREFCSWIEKLPYAKELIIGEQKEI